MLGRSQVGETRGLNAPPPMPSIPQEAGGLKKKKRRREGRVSYWLTLEEISNGKCISFAGNQPVYPPQPLKNWGVLERVGQRECLHSKRLLSL